MSSGKKSEKRISKHIENKVLYEIKCEILVFLYLVKFYSVYFVSRTLQIYVINYLFVS